MEGQVGRLGCIRREAVEGAGAREQPPQTDVCRAVLGERRPEGCDCKKALGPAERRAMVTHLVTVHGIPVQQTCRAVGGGRATYYRPLLDWAQRDAPVIAALTAVVAAHPRWGFWKCYDRLRLDGQPWRERRVWRVYCRLRLNLLRRTKNRLPQCPPQPLTVIPYSNAVWAIHIMSDTLYAGRRFRTLNVLDEGGREGLAIEIDKSLPAERVIRVLERVDISLKKTPI